MLDSFECDTSKKGGRVVFDLIRFTKPEHVESFLDGKIYMNSIGFFHMSGFEGQRDIFEGMAYYENPVDSPIALSFPEKLRNILVGNIGLSNEGAKYCNVACFYKLSRYKNQVEKIDERIRSFGAVAIHIFDVDRFIVQVMRAAKEKKDFYWCAGDVEYYDKNSKEAPQYVYDCFCKVKQLSYQKEWRLAILNDYSHLQEIAKKDIAAKYVDPYTFDIGDIRSIARVIPTDELLRNQARWFPKCSIVKHIPPERALTPEKADELFAKGIVLSRAEMDGAYWGNCDKNNIDTRAGLQKLLFALADGQTRITISTG